MMPQPQILPFELYRPIFEHVHSKNDLCKLARGWRLAQVEAERLIYQHLEGHSAKEIVLICRRICTLERIQPHIRSLHFSLRQSYQSISLMLRPLYALIARAFYQIPNLIRLQMHSYMPRIFEYVVSSYSISKSWPFRLLYLALYQIDTPLFSTFLPNQPDIQFLDTCLSAKAYLPPYIPKYITCLRVTMSDDTALAFFLSSQYITHLWVESLPEYLPLGTGLSVTALRFCYAPGRLSISMQFPALELLAVGDDYSTGLLRVGTNWVPMCTLLAQLTYLRLLAFFYVDREHTDLEDIITMLSKFRGVRPTLELVQLSFPDSTSWDLPRDWKWEGETWVSFPPPDNLTLWERSARDNAIGRRTWRLIEQNGLSDIAHGPTSR